MNSKNITAIDRQLIRIRREYGKHLIRRTVVEARVRVLYSNVYKTEESINLATKSFMKTIP